MGENDRRSRRSKKIQNENDAENCPGDEEQYDKQEAATRGTSSQEATKEKKQDDSNTPGPDEEERQKYAQLEPDTL